MSTRHISPAFHAPQTTAGVSFTHGVLVDDGSGNLVFAASGTAAGRLVDDGADNFVVQAGTGGVESARLLVFPNGDLMISST